MPDQKTPIDPPSINVLAGIAAALIPGLGHVVRGETARGIYAAVGVLGLFFGGMLVGGIDVVDSKEDRIWFFGQAIVGPIALAVDRVHQGSFKAYDADTGRLRTGYPDERRARGQVKNSSAEVPVWIADDPASPTGPPNIKSLGKVNELGTLAATLAGMLNLIVILDALFPTSRGREESGPKAVPA